MGAVLNKDPIIGAFVDSPNERNQLRQMHRAAQAKDAYREEMAQARMNALRSQMSAYQPLQNLMATYQPGNGFNPYQMQRNPMSSRAGFIGQPGIADNGWTPTPATLHGFAAGALPGAGIGATIGSVVPGVGNLVGLGLGAAIGGLAGGAIGGTYGAYADAKNGRKGFGE